VCGKFFVSTIPPRHERTAKILLLDIETLPMEVYAFSPYTEYITSDKVIKDWSISCWAAKWLFESEIMGEVVGGGDAIARRDDAILGNVWRLMDEAQVVVWHNGKRFDERKLNARFLLNGYHRPSRYLSVDTYKVSKEVFDNTYNGLDDLGEKLGIGKKIKMHFGDWVSCAQGDERSLEKMLAYCKKDIAPLLEDVYLRLLPWMSNHPNLGVYSDIEQDVCRNCSSTDLRWGGEYATPTGLWEGWRCGACGAIGRGNRKEHRINKVSIR
jgi:hypothetical protein